MHGMTTRRDQLPFTSASSSKPPTKTGAIKGTVNKQISTEHDPLGKYFVEECDCFTSHTDHEEVGWFDDLDKAKEYADKKASVAMYFNTYRVYESKKERTIGGLISNGDLKCLHEAKGKR